MKTKFKLGIVGVIIMLLAIPMSLMGMGMDQQIIPILIGVILIVIARFMHESDKGIIRVKQV